MPPDLHALERLLSEATPARCPALQLVVLQGTATLVAAAHGRLDPTQPHTPVTHATRFDLASLTKLFTTVALLRLVEAGQVTLDQPVSTVLPAFAGRRPVKPYEDPLQPGAWVTVPTRAESVDAGAVTFRRLLTHTAGLPAWRPLFAQPDGAAALTMAVESWFSCAPGEHVIYSDIGLILLGAAVAQLAGCPLDQAIRTLVLEPLGLSRTAFRPVDLQNAGDCAPTEFCRWRGCRIAGVVHDENAFRLGGVAGHAGLFSTAEEVARFGRLFLEQGRPLLSAATVRTMTRCHAVQGDLRRGLGFALWSPDPEASSHPFGRRTFGHTGFTGTSLWIDPARDLVVALLTNEVYHGRQDRQIGALRLDIHRSLVQALDRHAPPAAER